MYAVFVEVNATEAHSEAAREFLPRVAVPGARGAGAKGGYWLEAQGGRGVSIVVFETEDEARSPPAARSTCWAAGVLDVLMRRGAVRLACNPHPPPRHDQQRYVNW